MPALSLGGKMWFQLNPDRHAAIALVALLSMAGGVLLAFHFANEPSGFAATYIVVLLWFIALLLLIAGAALAIPRYTRWVGTLSIIAAGLLVASFFTVFKAIETFGEVRWQHEKMIPIGPDVQANLVIYFKVDATHDQIQSFWEETISTRQERGTWPLPGVKDILRLIPTQGHEAIAVSFTPSATEEQRENVKSKVKSSSIVYKVLEDVASEDVEDID